MAFDPSKPAANSPVSSAELRNQFNGLQTNIQAKAFEDDCVGRFAQCAVKPTAVSGLGMVVSDPPTQAEVQALSDKCDELLAVLKGP
jgi:hypothetical protein